MPDSRSRSRTRCRPDRIRALGLLASCRDGCTEALMLAHGVTIPQMVELVRACLATATAERVVAGRRTIEVARVRITEEGRQVPSVARTISLVTLGTFNERQGDQLLLRGDLKTGGWGRVFGQNTREHFAQGAQPDFDGTLAGFQAGGDLWRFESVTGHRDHIGFYVAQARASGTVHGSVNGFQGAPAGHVNLDASSYGGYWTHLGPSNWYIDAVLQGNPLPRFANLYPWHQQQRQRKRLRSVDRGGLPDCACAVAHARAAGPRNLATGLVGHTLDQISTITFDRADVFTGRAGTLLRGTFGTSGVLWQPYLKGNVWWGSNGFDTVTFATNAILTGRNGGTALEGGGGVTGRLTRNVSVYGDASYLSSVSGESRITLKGNVGLRVTW
jgi:type V secretory pathway adhesin AidA